MLRVMTAMFLAGIGTVAPAAAQPAPHARHNQSIGGAAHWALPYSERDAPPGVQLSWRRWLSPRIGVGTDFRWWRRNTTTVIDFPVQEGPDGIVVRAQRGQDDRRISSYGFGASMLTRASAGRLSFIAGGGPGFFVDRTHHDTRINESENSGSITVRSIGVHMLAEVAVQATARLSAFAGVHLELRDVRFVESGTGYPVIGIRFAF